MTVRTWPVDGPLDLWRSLRFALPASSPSVQRGTGDVAYATHTSAGPAVVTVKLVAGHLQAMAVGSGAEAALEEVPRIAGLDDKPDALQIADGPLRGLQKRYRGFRLGSMPRVFDTLLPIVLGQRVTTDEAKQSYRRICRAFGEAAPGERGLVLPPQPQALASLGYEDLHGFGVERTRAQIVIEVARRARRLEQILAMPADAARRRLGAVRGVGPWTVEQVMGAAWGDRDAVPRGDFHIPHTVSWVLAGEPRGDDDRMEELLEPFRPYRRRALLLVKMSGVQAPRYGPRTPKSAINQWG